MLINIVEHKTGQQRRITLRQQHEEASQLGKQQIFNTQFHLQNRIKKNYYYFFNYDDYYDKNYIHCIRLYLMKCQILSTYVYPYCYSSDS